MMDFQRARAQADKIDNAASSIRRESGRFTDCRNGVASCWSGDNASRFVSKMGLVSEDLDNIARNLEKTADAIRHNAKVIYDAEMEAKRIAELRTYNN
jgi:WXG100 family type VII secretion target